MRVNRASGIPTTTVLDRAHLKQQQQQAATNNVKLFVVNRTVSVWAGGTRRWQ